MRRISGRYDAKGCYHNQLRWSRYEDAHDQTDAGNSLSEVGGGISMDVDKAGEAEVAERAEKE